MGLCWLEPFALRLELFLRGNLLKESQDVSQSFRGSISVREGATIGVEWLKIVGYVRLERWIQPILSRDACGGALVLLVIRFPSLDDRGEWWFTWRIGLCFASENMICVASYTPVCCGRPYWGYWQRYPWGGLFLALSLNTLKPLLWVILASTSLAMTGGLKYCRRCFVILNCLWCGRGLWASRSYIGCCVRIRG